MVNRKFNGQDIGDSAVSFFEKLAKLESGGKYDLEDQKLYIGRYQIGTDVLGDMGWVPKGSKWSNVRFIGEAAKKWKLTDKRSFLKNPAAQDEVIMRSLKMRWLTLKKYKEKICQKISVPQDAKYIAPGKIKASESKVKNILAKKRNQGYKGEDLRGKKFILTSSGMLAASHLCGQGAMSNALGNNFKGVWGIPVDGNAVPSLFYHENLSGHDLSVIIGYKDNCRIDSKVVEKNDSQVDNKNINNQAKIKEGNNNKNTENSGSVVNSSEETNRQGVFVFNGQKFEEVWDNEEYKKDRFEKSKAPELVFVSSEEAVLERLQIKFNDKNMYNSDYVKYLETKTARKILEENKEDINIILKIYDEATKDSDNIGNVIRQKGFDILRGREENESIRIQDIIYYVWSNPISNKSRIESLEHVLSQYSAKYVKYPDRKPIVENNIKTGFVDKIQNTLNNSSNNMTDENSTHKIEKNVLPERYDKYMKGIKDIDEIVIRIVRKDSSDFSAIKCLNLLKELHTDEIKYQKFYGIDENGINQYPLIKRLIDNIIIEFLSVQTGFKGENETKYFDNHKYKDSNIVRNYLLWYIKTQRGMDIPSKTDTGLYNRLEKLGNEIRVTTVLNDWITSKSAIKVRNIRKISNLIDEIYENYRDKSDFEKDKSIMHKLFKDCKELRDYSANIDSMDIYSFYKSFYDFQNIVKPTGELFVNDNCMLKCTLGEDISKLVINQNSITLRGGKQANINDKNILPFKKCRAIGICKPELLGQWEKNTDVKVGEYPALLDISTIKCKYGGIISIDDAGQKEIGIAEDKKTEVKESVRDADCVYKLLVDVCRDINNNFMQTSLKKSCQKFASAKKYISQTENKLKPYINKKTARILTGKGLTAEEEKEYNKIIDNNRKKMSVMKEEVTKEKENQLRGKIFQAFRGSYKRVKQLSNPNIDTKGIIRKKGISLCDHERKNFYSAKILPAMVYGYLMQAANLSMKYEEKEIIKAELTMDEKISKSKIIGLDSFNVVGNRFNLKGDDKKETKIGDILTWIGMGGNLYDSTKGIPTEWDILKIIRKSGKILVMCPFNQMEWNKNHGRDKTSMIVKNSSKISSGDSGTNKNNSVSKISKSTIAENSSKTEKREDSCASGNCPHLGVQGKYTFYVERFEEYYNTDPKKWTKVNAKKNSTISYFSILDPSGKKLEGYDGYVIEPGGPDQIIAERNQRIVEGTHNLRWHYKSKTKHSPAYMSILVHSKKISPNRGILIHWGLSRGWSVGCLIPSTERSIMSDRKIYKAVNSMSLFDKIMNFAYKIEKINKKSRTAQNKFDDMKGEVSKEAIKGKSINNIVLVVKNNIKRTL
jgi:serine-type D-ala-D-ala carboxypeptidase family protein